MIKIILSLFDGSGDGGASAGEGAEGDLAVSPAAIESVESQPSPDERKAAYDKFKTDYKAEYDAEVQSIVKDRLKKSNARTNELNNKLKSVTPILEHIAQKYNVDVNDTGALLEAFQNDDELYEQEAYDKGMTVAQVKEFHKIERENQALRDEQFERAKQAQIAAWDNEAQNVKQMYPTFDIENELANDQFVKLLDSLTGVVNNPVQTAYEVVHGQDLMQGAMQFTAQKTAEKITNSVKANKQRPNENGLSSTSASLTQNNIRAFSREQMEDLKRRAMAGEKITLK